MNRKQLMIDSYKDIVDGSTCKPTTRKPATSNQPAFALLLLAGTLLLLALAFLPQPALAATPITNCTELQNIRNNSAGDYYLANDIDCSCTSGWNGGAGFEPIGKDWSSKFTGTFDGQGYKITNLYINRTSINYVGLFGYTGSGSEIKDVGLEEVDVSGNMNVGGLVGYNKGTITNSYSSGSVSGSSRVGGLVGINKGTITNSYSSGSVTGSSEVGGLVGSNRDEGTITNSYSSCSVSGSSQVGGLVGSNYEGTITNSYSSGSVTGSGSYAGGLVGFNYEGTITNSYSSGSVTGSSEVGGLVGSSLTGTITNSYWDIHRSGRSNCVGSDSGTTNCTGKNSGNSEPDYWYYSTHAPMDNWDFVDVWGIVEEVTYPYLQWQFACTCGDICVNETGWWRDGGTFNPSNTPIQHAIDNATAGDTICVKDGTYNENVDVTKSHLTIRSENGPSVTTVSGSLNPNKHVFDITDQTDVTLEGFEIRDAHGASQSVAGIYMNKACECNISGNIVTNISATGTYNDAYGIWLYSSSDNSFHTTTVYNLSAYDDAYGIYLYSSSDNSFGTSTVYNFDANDNAYGIRLYYSSDNSFGTTTVYNLSSATDDVIGIALASFSDNNSFHTSTTVYNLDANSEAYGILLSYSSDNSFHTTTVYNLDANTDANGIYLYYSSHNSFNSGSISDLNAPTWWDFYSDASSHGNSAEDITISSFPTTISFTYENGIKLKSVATPPADPADKRNISKYVTVSEVTADSWIFMNVSYEEGDLGGVIENSLRMWQHNGTDWTLVPGTNGVNTAENYVYANITEFSVFAPLGVDVNLELNKTGVPDPVSPGGTLNYTIRVNNTGNTTATNVTVKETYDENVTFVAAVPAPSQGNDTWQFATLNASEPKWVNISVLVNASVFNGTVLHNIVNVSCDEGVADYDIENTTVFSDVVHITSFEPPSPVNDTVCNWRTFNVSVDQTVNVSWYLNGSFLFTNESVRDASCRLHADAAGVHNVSANASNANSSGMQTWTWNVTAGLNCTCGDICVNETGWWRDGEAFFASGTPIQHAIDNAITGDTICVKDGTYNENVDVTKSHLTIRSENGSSVTTVSASLDPNKHVFKITDQTNVTLKGFEIRDAHGASQSVAGIYMYNASECNISDNIVTNISATGGRSNAYGIWLYSSSDNNSFHTSTVYNLDANEYAYGIYLRSSSDNSFDTSTVYNLDANYYAYGIALEYSSDNNSFDTSTVYNLDANDYAFGIYLRSSSDNSFDTSTVYNLSADKYANGILLFFSSDNNSFDTSTVYNLDANDYAYGIWLHYSSDNNSFDTSTVYNLSANLDAYGIYLYSSSDNSFISGSISDINAPTWWDFYSEEDAHGNSAEDITICSFTTTISFTYDNGIKLKSVHTPPADPAEKRNISKYVTVTEVTADSWIFMNVSYEEGDLGGVIENSLRLWQHNGTDWTLVPGTNGVNTAENYVYANITEFSVFAPLGNVTGVKLEINKTDVPDPVSPGGTLNYTIRVNNTGNATATNVTVKETYDGNVTFVSAVPAPSLDNDTWVFATLNVNETKWVNISVLVNASAPNGTVLHNVVNVSCDEGVTDSDTENTTVFVAPVPVLEINKTGVPDPVPAGGTLNYTIRVNNTGNATATNVTVKETYDENVAFVAAVPAPSQGNDTWQFATLNASEPKWVNISVLVNASVFNGTVLHNIVNVSCDEGVADYDIENTTVFSDVVHITSFEPPSPVNDTVCNWRTFNVSVDQTVNVSWYLNGSFLFTNESVRDASCRLHADAAGVHNVSANASNANSSGMQTWTWNVTAGLNCTCGDICVNETGWWRDGEAFFASGTPIQHAIDNAITGDTICVKDGTYNENVDVTKSHLTIRSENGSSVTTVSASLDPNKHVFKITDQTNVTLKGFEIRDAHGTSQTVAGIYMYNARECNISNNIVTNISTTSWNAAHGIWLYSSSDNSFDTSAVYNLSAGGPAFGIRLDSSSDNSFHTSTVYNLDANSRAFGIWLRSSSDNNSFHTSTVYNLSVANDDANGIWLHSSSDNSFHTSTVYNLSSEEFANGIRLVSSSGNSFHTSTVYNLSANDDANGIRLYSSSGNSFDTSTVYNLSANDDANGIRLDYSSDNSFTSGSISYIKAPTWWDFYSDASSHGNSAEDITISSFPTTIFFTYDNGIGLKSVETAPPDPADKRNISKYVNVTDVTADSWIFVNVSYEECDLGSVEENSLRLWKHNGTDWTLVPGTNGVNTAENYVYANITEFSVFAPLGNVTGVKLEINKSGVPDPVSPGGTLNYSISVNNTGNATATNVTVMETYDGNVTFVTAVPAPSQGNDTWQFTSLNVSETRWINISVSVNASVLNGTVLHNVVNVACNEGVMDSDTENTTVFAAPVPALEITKTDAPDPVSPGGTLNYTIHVNNTGNATATNVTVKETYDENVTFVSAVPVPSPGNDTWKFATLNVSETRWINISVTVNASVPNGTVLQNIVNVTCDEGVTDSDTADTTVLFKELHCTCGGICVNETGWWRDAGAFIASGTPIQAAINNATAGDIICVKDGTYNENVDVTKSHLTIRSEHGPSVTAVSASLNPNKHVFKITDQTNVTLKGFEIRDASGTSQDVAGICMNNASECKISDNVVTDISATGLSSSAFGIWLKSSSDNSFYTSTVYNLSARRFTYGICLDHSSDNSFVTTTVYNLSTSLYTADGILLRSSSDNNSFVTTTVYNLYADQGAVGIHLWSSSDNSFVTNTVYNSSSETNAEGIYLRSSSDNSFVTSTVYNISAKYGADGIGLYSSSNNNAFSSGSISDINAPTWWDFCSDANSHGNSAGDITISSFPTTISFTYENGIKLKSVETPPADPADKRNISKYVNAVEVTTNSWIFMNVSYEDGDLGGVEENSLRLWRHNGTDWTVVPGTNGVNTAENYVYANITEFSVFAPLGNVTGAKLEINKTDNPDPVSPGGTLNYSISVNNTGNATATNVTVMETYDENVTFVAAVPAPSSGDDTWQFTSLNVSETRWINISVSVNASVLNGTVLHNIVNVSCAEGVTDTDTENTTVFVVPVLNCTCGDICVNETGWWRDGGAFNASNTPIQDAIDNATAGDTICVKDGTYTENVDVNVNNLIIKSENGSANCIVNASNPGNHVFEVTGNYVNISGFTIEGATGAGGYYYAGIYLDDNIHNCMISHNTIVNNNYGIWLHKSNHDNTLTNNNVSTNTGTGISLYRSCTNNRLTNNIASGNQNDGIMLAHSSNYNTISNNTANSNDRGISLSDSHNNTLTNNMANSNTRWNGIILTNSNDNVLERNTCLDNTHGIKLDKSNRNRLEQNNCSNNYHGFEIQSSRDNTIRNNIANENSEHGVYIFRYWATDPRSAFNTLVNNNVSNNTKDGIKLANQAQYNNFTDNNVSLNKNDGISLGGSCNHNNLAGNTVTGNSRYGIGMESAHYNNLTRNTVNANTGRGIYMRGPSNNNMLYNNYFNNTNNAYDEGHNTWNITKEAGTNIIGGPYLGGNYWSDYAGIDTNGDGLGNTLLPYNASGKIATGGDWHPLTTVGYAPPEIISFAPPSPVNDTVCNWRTFNVTINQMVNVSWYLNTTLQHTNVSTKEANYTLHAEVVGEHNVSAIASNENGTDMQTWVWNVTAAPLPVLRINKTGVPDPVLAGGILNYSIRVNNTGNTNATNVTVTETYDENVTFVGAVPVPSQGNDTWVLATLNVSETRWINISVTVNASVLNGTVLHNIVNVTCDEGVTDSDTEDTTVLAPPVPPPNITSFAPPSPVNDTVCNWRTFNVTVNQTVNVSWYLNNTLQHTNESTKEAKYTLHAEVVGEHNVSAIASNENGTDMQTWVWNVTAAQVPVLEINKKDNPDPVSPGGILNYSIRVNNTGNTNATNVTVTETYDENVTFVGAVPVPSQGNDTWEFETLNVSETNWINISVTVNASVLNGTVLHNIVNVTCDEGVTDSDTEDTTVLAPPVPPPNITSFAPPSPVNDTVCNWRTFNVTVNQTVNVSWYLNNTLQHTNESTKEAKYTLHAEVVGEHNVSAIASNENGTDMQTWVWNVTAAQVPVLEINKTDNPDPVSPGGILNYSIRVNNTGNTNATNVTVTETYDENVTFVGAVPVPSQGNDTWEFETLNVSETNWINISVTVNASVLNGTVLHNIVNVTCDEGVTDSDTEDTTVLAPPVPPPNITSFAPPSPVNDTVCNWRTFNVTVNQTVNVSWYLNNTLQHTNESTKEAKYTLHAEVVGEHNVSAIASNENGTDMQSWIWNVTAAPLPVLEINKTDNPDPVLAGGTLNYTIAVNNTGNATATNVTVKETYDGNVTFVSAVPAPSLGNGTWQFPTLNASETRWINISVIVNASVLNGTVLHNIVNVSCAEGVSDTDTENTTVFAIPAIANVKLSKWVKYKTEPESKYRKEIADAKVCNNVSFKIAIQNNGTGTNLTGISVTDVLNCSLGYINDSANIPPNIYEDNCPANQTLLWQFATVWLEPGEYINITFDAHVDECGSDRNYARVDAISGTGHTVSDEDYVYVNCTVPVCVETATGTGNACVATDSGTIEDLVAVDESTLPEEGKPELVFPHGFFSFNVTGLTQGQTVVVTLTLPDIVPVGTEYWKYHAAEGGWIRIPMGSDDGDNILTITLVDGGLGDDDGIANGLIVDQGGPGVRAIKPKLTKSAPTSVVPGGTIPYTILYANLGPVALTDVTITENYPKGVTFISAVPAPDAGTNNKWSIGTLPAGASGQITIKVKVPDSPDLSFTETGSVTGEGFVMVSKDLSTEQKPYRLKNVVTIICAETDPVTASALTTVSGVPGTSLELTEHGSGIYESEEILNFGTKNKSIRLQKSTEAEYQPTSFYFSDGFSVVFTNKWMQDICSKNMVLGDAMHKKIKDATYIRDETKTETGEYGTSMEFASSFQGAAHIGAVSKDVTTSEDYIGEFEIFWAAKEECQYLFNWSRVPGNDSEKLIRFLVDILAINWAENATITKSNNDRIINISTDWHSAEVILAANNEAATVKVANETIYVLDVRTEDGSLNVYDCRLRKISESVAGVGYVMVDKELTSSHIQVVEHGSGIYSSDMDFDSQRLNKSTEAEYRPTTFNFSDGFGVNFSSNWMQSICSKDKKAGTAIHKKISDAASIADDTTATKSSMAFETSFNGSIHIGARTEEVAISEDYFGRFNVSQVIRIGDARSTSTSTSNTSNSSDLPSCP